MKSIGYSEFEEQVDNFFDEIGNNNEPILVTREKGNIVVLSAKDYNSMIETNYLLENRYNSIRLLKSIKQLEK